MAEGYHALFKKERLITTFLLILEMNFSDSSF